MAANNNKTRDCIREKKWKDGQKRERREPIDVTWRRSDPEDVAVNEPMFLTGD